MTGVLTRITDGFLLVAVPVFLLFPGFGGYTRMFYWKFGAFLTLTVAYLLTMAVTAAVRRLPLLPRMGTARVALLIYLAWTWVATALSPNAARALLGVSRFEGALTVTLYCLLFLLVSVHGRVTARTVAVFGAAVSAECLLCLAQLFGLDPFGLYPEGMNFYNCGRNPRTFLGTVGNVDFLAAFFAVAIPILLFTCLCTRHRLRLWLLVPLALSVTVLLAMGTVGGVLGAAVGCTLFGGLCLPRRLRRITLCALALAAALLLVAARCIDGKGAWHALHAILSGTPDPLLGSGRVHIWQTVLAAARERLFAGYGPDTMLLHGFAPFTREDAVLGSLVAHIDTAHSEPLNILYHQGLPALVAYLVFLGTLLWEAVRRRTGACIALGAALLCYFVQSLFGISVFLCAVWFWLAAALLLAHIHSIPKENSHV